MNTTMPEPTRKRVGIGPETWRANYAGVCVGVITERNRQSARCRSLAMAVRILANIATAPLRSFKPRAPRLKQHGGNSCLCAVNLTLKNGDETRLFTRQICRVDASNIVIS